MQSHQSVYWAIQFYDAPSTTLDRKFERHYVIINLQLESVLKASQEKIHESTGLISFNGNVLNFVNVLKENKQAGDLQPNSTLCMALDKLPQNLK